MGLILSADIGGTQIRVAVYSHDSTQPIEHQRISTHASGDTVYERLTALIDSVWKDEIEIISVASAGPLNPETGIILSSPNISGWIDFPLGPKLTERYHIPAHISNDANLAALGEWKYGAGQGHHDLLYFTISTGIGGGVISQDRLLLGYRGLAAELGHITVLPDGPRCPCGQHGHLEGISSGPSTVNYVLERLEAGEHSSLKPDPTLNARDVAQAAQLGDPLAIRAFERAGHFLGQAVADFLHIFNPSIVIFGGGVSQSGDLLFEPMKKSMKEHIMDPGYLDGLIITTAQLGDDAGLLGALAYALIKLSK